MSEHLDIPTLTAVVTGYLPVTTNEGWAASVHLASCKVCRQAAEALTLYVMSPKDAILNRLRSLNDQQREAVFDALRGEFCLGCGGVELPCAACNDE
jgi:hypothetical protein